MGHTWSSSDEQESEEVLGAGGDKEAVLHFCETLIDFSSLFNLGRVNRVREAPVSECR